MIYKFEKGSIMTAISSEISETSINLSNETLASGALAADHSLLPNFFNEM